MKKTDLYTIKFDYRQNYLYAFVGDGTDSLSVSKDFWLKVLNECKKREYNRVLIEEDLEGNISVLEAYELAVWLSSLDIANVSVAFVDLHLGHREMNDFAQLIASNRGFRVNIFNDVKEAEKWL